MRALFPSPIFYAFVPTVIVFVGILIEGATGPGAGKPLAMVLSGILFASLISMFWSLALLWHSLGKDL